MNSQALTMSLELWLGSIRALKSLIFLCYLLIHLWMMRLLLCSYACLSAASSRCCLSEIEKFECQLFPRTTSNILLNSARIVQEGRDTVMNVIRNSGEYPNKVLIMAPTIAMHSLNGSRLVPYSSSQCYGRHGCKPYNNISSRPLRYISICYTCSLHML